MWHARLTFGRATRAALIVAAACLMASHAHAGCTWKFDWYCSDCAKIGGRTTGEQGGYASESACEAARGRVHSAVSTMTCDRVGWCDTPAAPQPESRPAPSASGRTQTYSSTPDRAAEAETHREEAVRARAEAERKARAEAAFEKAKADLLGQLKGSTLDQDSGLKGTGGETLKLKSGTPAFGIKSNPGGDLRLKDAPAVKVADPETAAVDPSFFTKPKARLRIRDVPNPMLGAKGTWRRYVKSDRAGLVLDALEEGKGDLDAAIAWLDGQIVRHGSHVKASSALSFLEGLKSSYIAAGAEYRRQAPKPGAPATLESKLLLGAVLGQAGPRKWPGDMNPDPRPNPNDWRVRRTTMMLQALEETPGDLEAAYGRLQDARDTVTAENAEQYLRGVYAYWDFLGGRVER